MTLIANVFAALLLAVAPQAAAAPSPLTIAPGETVTARVSDDGASLVEISRGPAPTAKGDAAKPAENTIRFIFARANGDQRMLSIQNGYDRAFHFAARMFLGKRSAPTSICTIPPHLVSFENWQDPIDRLELSAPTLAAGGAGAFGCF
ncbi:MAG: hypothetical protein QOE79_660 [Sphingomonadales bacterium]|jgi:hypothetical protein|nr:hypothetical protein [Sphingomonadales bacterium]